MSKKKNKTKKSIDCRKLQIKSRKAYRLNQHAVVIGNKRKDEKHARSDDYSDSEA